MFTLNTRGSWLAESTTYQDWEMVTIYPGPLNVHILNVSFHRIGPLGRFDHRVAMSVCQLVCLSLFMQFFARVEPILLHVWSPSYYTRGAHLITRVEP